MAVREGVQAVLIDRQLTLKTVGVAGAAGPRLLLLDGLGGLDVFDEGDDVLSGRHRLVGGA